METVIYKCYLTIKNYSVYHCIQNKTFELFFLLDKKNCFICLEAQHTKLQTVKASNNT